MTQLPANTINNPLLCIDANILVEIVLSRADESLARKILMKHAGSLAISTLTAHLVVHFGQTRTSLPILRKFLSDYTILPLSAEDFWWAFENVRGTDFEDALQIGSAIREGCEQFITLDAKLAKRYQDMSNIQVILAR